MSTNDFNQARVRVNEHGARYLQTLLMNDIQTMLLERQQDTDVRTWNARIARARRVLQEVNRCIEERWPAAT